MGLSEGNQNIIKLNTTAADIITTFDVLTQWGQIPESDLKNIYVKWGKVMQTQRVYKAMQ